MKQAGFILFFNIMGNLIHLKFTDEVDIFLLVVTTIIYFLKTLVNLTSVINYQLV